MVSVGLHWYQGFIQESDIFLSVSILTTCNIGTTKYLRKICCSNIFLRREEIIGSKIWDAAPLLRAVRVSGNKRCVSGVHREDSKTSALTVVVPRSFSEINCGLSQSLWISSYTRGMYALRSCRVRCTHAEQQRSNREVLWSRYSFQLETIANRNCLIHSIWSNRTPPWTFRWMLSFGNVATVAFAL